MCIRNRFAECSKEFADFEKINRFTLLAKEFTVEDGEVTPTMKIKRKSVAGIYKPVIDRTYAE